MASEPWFAILADKLDATQRQLITEEVKRHSDPMWHGLDNAWLVHGGTAREWRERLGVFVPLTPSVLIVLELPPEGSRRWSARGPKPVWNPLVEMYAGADGRNTPKQS